MMSPEQPLPHEHGSPLWQRLGHLAFEVLESFGRATMLQNGISPTEMAGRLSAPAVTRIDLVAKGRRPRQTFSDVEDMRFLRQCDDSQEIIRVLYPPDHT